MKKVIVVCFALAIVLEAAFASSAQAQLFGGRFRIRQNRNNNCCCQPANCGTQAQAASYDGGEVAVSSDSVGSYEGEVTGQVVSGSMDSITLQPTPMMSEVAPVSYEQPVSGDCGCGGSVGQVSYEAPVQQMSVAPASDCGCCGGCGEVGQVSYEGAVQGEVVQGGYVEGAVQGQPVQGDVTAAYPAEGGVIYEGQPTLATQGETFVSEEVIKEEVIEADTTIESPATESAAPATAPASEDSVPDAPKTDA